MLAVNAPFPIVKVLLAVAIVGQSRELAAMQLSPAAAPVTVSQTDTPKAALSGLARAIESGQAGEVRRLLAADGEAELQLVAALADLAAAAAEFRQVLATRFSADQLGDIPPEATAVSVGQAAIISATEQINGDRAQLLLGGKTVHLLKTPEGWRVPVAQLFADGVEQSTFEATLRIMRPQTEAIRKTAGELKAGRYNTVQEAGQMLRKHILEGITPPTAPASTKPAK
jgi:hypothetical protein